MTKKTAIQTKIDFSDVVAKINKKYSTNPLISLTGRDKVAMPHIPTGIYSLDKQVLGIGGLARGRVHEWFGVAGGGKTTLLYRSIASAQKLFPNEACALIDSEFATDPTWLAKNEVDIGKLIFHQPNSGEEALSLAEDLIKEGCCSIVGVDSVANLVPQAELSGDMGEAHVGRQARMMAQALRKLIGLISKHNVVLIFTNQIRDSIGMTIPGMGPRTTTPGGRALPFAASVRLKIARTKTIKVEGESLKNAVSIRSEKNKLFAPFREVEVELDYNYGFDCLGNVIDELIWAGIIDKAGSWYSYKGDKIGQGKEACKPLVEGDLPKFIGLLDKHYEDTEKLPVNTEDNTDDNEQD
jgi:recombination protein RecA